MFSYYGITYWFCQNTSSGAHSSS
uniref:Uncharacterized protein n=1 Tax=Arundo donax TaxID=35708 RepID=A0A0A9B8F9_ARUDO